jgi:MFS family permease
VSDPGGRGVAAAADIAGAAVARIQARREAAIGIWAAIGGLAAAAGPPIGGLLVQVSWRLVFLVNVPVGLVALFYGLSVLRESRDQTQERPDLLGSGLIVAGVGVLALGLVKAPDWGWATPAP